MESHTNKQLIATMFVFATVAVVVGAIIMFNKKSLPNTLSAANPTTAQETPTSNVSPSPQKTGSSGSTNAYNDGTYSTTADYYTPEDTDRIKVTLTVKNGVVSSVSASTSTSSRESRQYDSAFLNAYKSYVVGKSLSGLNLNRVSGASLTTNGFNDALDTIRRQAQA